MAGGTPSAARTSSLTRTGVRFLATLVLLTVVWFVLLAPSYDRVIASAGVRALRLLESPPMTASVRFEGPHAVVTHAGSFADLGEQRLELRTHHNNAPLLLALILAMPGRARDRRGRTVLIGFVVLAATHVVHFMLEVHWHYALANVGPYRVTDLRYLDLGLWQSLDSGAQVMKLTLNGVRELYVHVGRLIAPIVLWMILCPDALRRVEPLRQAVKINCSSR